MRKTTMTMSGPVRLFAIAATMLCAPGIAHALGLGKLSVYTALNEPLKAEIRFTSLTEKEFRTLDARLITAPHLLGVSALESAAPFLGIGITLVEREPKVYSLLLQSEQPMREPFLRLILEIEWAGGRLVREFTTLIDPRELRAPIAEGMPEFPSIATVGDLGRQDSKTSSRADSRRDLVALADKAKKPTPHQQPEVLTGRSADTPEPEVSISQESTVETTAPEPAASPTPASTQPTLSKQEQAEAQRRLIQTEIENWAKERGLSLDKEPEEIVVSDVDIETAADVDVDVTTETPEIDLDTSIPNETPEAVSPSTQDSSSGLLGRDLLMVFVGLVVAVALVAGGVLVRIYLRHIKISHDHTLRDDEAEDEARTEVSRETEQVPGDDVEDLSEYGDRRSGYGRRKQFAPVEVDRREGPRRQRDLFAKSDHVDMGHANTIDESEVYMACGHDENAELLLKEALAKDPDRQDLKVKLLAIYQHRGDPEAFDRLAGELYSDVQPKKGRRGRVGDLSEPQADQNLPNRDAETESDFDHAIEFEIPDGEPDETSNDNEAADIDSPESPDGEKSVDADIFEREIEALAMTVPTEGDAEIPEPESTPANEDLDDATMESLEVDDFAEIEEAVDRGVDLLEPDKGLNQDDTDNPQSINTVADEPPRKSAKRSGKRGGKSKKSSVEESGEQEDKSSTQWKEPSTKIDLAKAYIAMGDAERARSILDEVLEEWNPGDGTEG